MVSIDVSANKNIFAGKKILIVVPHQDDEINLMGNILDELSKNNEVYVTYTVEPEDEKKAGIRKKEALNALQVFGVDKDKVVFLGYPDSVRGDQKHYFIKNRKAYIESLERLVEDINPDVIFGTDFDFHPDHRAIAIGLRSAICNVIRRRRDYRPMVFFGFCYDSAWHGVEDYSVYNLADTVIESEVLSNVSLQWKDRYSLYVDRKASFIWNKPCFKALKCQRSQYGVLHAKSVINRDNVFWRVRTDNVLLDADIESTVGESGIVNDLLVIDTDDIDTKDCQNINYSSGISSTGDETLDIHIKLERKKRINTIVIHANPNSKKVIEVEGIVKLDGLEVNFTELEPYGRETVISFNEIETQMISISIRNSKNDECFGIVEIEAFEGEENKTDDELKDESYSRMYLTDIINDIGFGFIKFATRLRRKIEKLVG